LPTEFTGEPLFSRTKALHSLWTVYGATCDCIAMVFDFAPHKPENRFPSNTATCANASLEAMTYLFSSRQSSVFVLPTSLEQNAKQCSYPDFGSRWRALYSSPVRVQRVAL
jgi:hypothetical protein